MIEHIELFEHDDYLWAMVDDVDGISVDMIRLQHADYIANWLQVLRNDNRAVFTAAKAAQAACDFILQACGAVKPEPNDEDDTDGDTLPLNIAA